MCWLNAETMKMQTVDKDAVWYSIRQHFIQDGKEFYTYGTYVRDHPSHTSKESIYADWYLFDGEKSILIMKNMVA